MRGSAGSHRALPQRMDPSRDPQEHWGEKWKKGRNQQQSQTSKTSQGPWRVFSCGKTTKKSIKAGKKRYIETLAAETGEAAPQGNQQKLYTTIKKTSGKFGKPEKLEKDKWGTPYEEGQRKWCVKLFEELQIEGSEPQWCISSMLHSPDTPFWSGTLEIDQLQRIHQPTITYQSTVISHYKGDLNRSQKHTTRGTEDGHRD